MELKLIKTLDGKKDMIFTMESGDLRVVNNVREVYVTNDWNGYNAYIVKDINGKEFIMIAEGVAKIQFGVKKQ